MRCRLVLSALVVWLVTVPPVFLSRPLAAVQAPKAPPAAVHRAVVDKHCLTCHSKALHTAGLVLEGLDLTDVGANAEVWEKVARKLRAGAMPPAGLPRPTPA